MNDIGGNTPGREQPERGNSAGAAAVQKNCRVTAHSASGVAAVDDLAGGVDALRKHVSATGRIKWVLTVNGIEVTMTTGTLMSAARAYRKIMLVMIDLGVFDALPEPMTQKEWHALIASRLARLGTPVGRARTTDAAWRRPPFWRRWFAWAA